MKEHELIEELIEKVRCQMVSSGFLPFTMLKIYAGDGIKNYQIAADHYAPCFLLFLKRLNYSLQDMEDYFRNSDEMAFIPDNAKEDYVRAILSKYDTSEKMEHWKETIANMAIGMAHFLSSKMSINLYPFPGSPQELGRLLDFNPQFFAPYMLFAVGAK